MRCILGLVLNRKSSAGTSPSLGSPALLPSLEVHAVNVTRTDHQLRLLNLCNSSFIINNPNIRSYRTEFLITPLNSHKTTLMHGSVVFFSACGLIPGHGTLLTQAVECSSVSRFSVWRSAVSGADTVVKSSINKRTGLDMNMAARL